MMDEIRELNIDELEEVSGGLPWGNVAKNFGIGLATTVVSPISEEFFASCFATLAAIW